MLKSFCETRWTEKYKSISHFSSNIIHIVEALEEFSLNGNGETRKKANYLYPATRNSSFILNVITDFKVFICA